MTRPRHDMRAADEADEVIPSLDTLPEAARRMRRQSAELGATSFSILFILQRGRSRLLPVMDSDYPGMAASTRLLLEVQDEDMLRHVALRTTPFTLNGPAMTLDGEELARFIAAGGVQALAFPVFSEDGHRGVVVFEGMTVWPDSDAVWDAHCRALQGFGLVARLRPTTSGRRPGLTRREIECLKLTASGLTSEEIAQRLNLSVHTANQYIASTAQKLDATNRIHAVAKAIRLGLID